MVKRSDFPWVPVLPLLVWMLMALVVPRVGAISIHAALSRWDRATSFVLGDDGRLWCWGANESGQYGDGTTVGRLSGRPAPLPEGVTGWKGFAAGLRYFAIDLDGRLYAWGEPEMPWESRSSAAPNSRASLPVRLGSRTWKKAVPPVLTREAGEVPFGLGIDSMGLLWWLRAPRPALESAEAFSGYREEAADLPIDAGAVVDVVGGGRCFLALTASGRVFASGQSSLGLRGPRSPLAGDGFNMGFLEVDPPAGVAFWTRIAVVSNQAFAWSEHGDLYVWGNLADSNWLGMKPTPNPRLVPGVPSGLPIREVVGGHDRASYLFVDEAGDVFGCGNPESQPDWPYFGDYGLDLFDKKARMLLEPVGLPVQKLSSTTLFTLVLGSDGVVRAHGANQDGQLGGIVALSLTKPKAWAIPAGEAPFLSGVPLKLPRLDLVADPGLMIEPSNEARTNGRSGRLTVVRSGLTNLEVSPIIRISTRLTTGEPNPDTNAIQVVLNHRLFPLVKLAAGQSTYEIPLPPAYYEAGNDPLKIDFTLMPSPWYDLGTNPLATVTYQATPADNRTPQVRLLWPPERSRVYGVDKLEYVLELLDPDGYVERLSLQHQGGFTSFPGIEERFQPLPAGTPRLFLARFDSPFGGGLYEFSANVTVIDNQGKQVVIRNVVTPTTKYLLDSGHSLRLQVGGRPRWLLLPSTTGPLVLEESVDLKTWQPLKSFSRLSGVISFPGELSADGAMLRFFRVRNPEMPVVPSYGP